jgi:uncharacterized protein YbjT (DUF2867 family)
MADELVRANRLVTVFGGSGFVGRHVVRALARRGWRVRVAVRRPDLAFHLQPLGKVGQIHAVQANLRYPDSVAHALRDAEAAVNLVGILQESGAQHFDAIQHLGAQTVAQAVKEAGIGAFVHMSAIGADPASLSVYGQTKAFGEAAVRICRPDTIILRPSVIFGPEDQFFNRFAAMARFMPMLPLIGGGNTYELGGPEVATLRRINEFVLKVTQRRRPLVAVSFRRAEILALVTEVLMKMSLGFFPAIISITKDQVELLRIDNIVSPRAEAEGRTLRGLGIMPEPFETFVPSYLYRYRKTGQFASTHAI